MLNYLQREYNPDEIVIEVWDVEWIQNRFSKNKTYLQPGIEDKLDFVENKEISKRFRQILSFFGINKYKKYFKVFGGWEVLDESRNFPHDWWNLALLHHYSIRKWKFILVGWVWTSEKFKTKRCSKYYICSYFSSENIELALLMNGFNKLKVKKYVLELIEKVKLTKYKNRA